MVSSLLLALLLTCCSFDCFSSQSMTNNGIWATPLPGEDETEEDAFLSQVRKTSTDLGLDSNDPEGPVSAAGSASTHTPPCSHQDMTGTGNMSPAQPGAGRTPGPYSQPGNSNLVNLFNEFFKQGPTIMAVPRPSLFTLRDTSQKVVRCHHNHLVASPQTANAPPEKISVVPNQFMDPSHFPIIMGINGGTRCLSCGTSAQPTLMLEDKKIMDLYQNSQEAKRFTFTCSATGSTLRFESVAFPGWYLSTSPRNDQPLRVTNRLGEAEITNFYFKKV
ncbi:interleukin-36 receptor antagonist protein-like isoform X2 [Trachemys scripta elegans]|uniref:interleukin-36 receptor antagonist protein-like isoform X2 n=1 Tax=Trachemys scripta elegans TaxID=31138 RepID=UPI001556160A|nr:interleukin-36 receptor antagonist protein-like isoform X2 [Trachemys scripta elegans]